MSAQRTAPRRRDPERRRAEILDAAIRAIDEHGLANVSHRRIAELAGVPLGSTTYYFPTLADLVAEAVAVAVERWVAELRRQWTGRPGDAPDAVLADVAARYLADRAQAIREYELYVAAAREPRLRPVAALWHDELQRLLETVASPRQARAVTMLLDGAMLRALVLGEPLDEDALRSGVRALLR